MQSIDIKFPMFRVLLNKSVNGIEQEAKRLFKDGWYPVGGVGRKGNEWVQTMVKEGKVTVITKVPDDADIVGPEEEIEIFKTAGVGPFFLRDD